MFLEQTRKLLENLKALADNIERASNDAPPMEQAELDRAVRHLRQAAYETAKARQSLIVL